MRERVCCCEMGMIGVIEVFVLTFAMYVCMCVQVISSEGHYITFLLMLCDFAVANKLVHLRDSIRSLLKLLPTGSRQPSCLCIEAIKPCQSYMIFEIVHADQVNRIYTLILNITTMCFLVSSDNNATFLLMMGVTVTLVSNLCPLWYTKVTFLTSDNKVVFLGYAVRTSDMVVVLGYAARTSDMVVVLGYAARTSDMVVVLGYAARTSDMVVVLGYAARTSDMVVVLGYAARTSDMVVVLGYAARTSDMVVVLGYAACTSDMVVVLGYAARTSDMVVVLGYAARTSDMVVVLGYAARTSDMVVVLGYAARTSDTNASFL